MGYACDLAHDLAGDGAKRATPSSNSNFQVKCYTSVRNNLQR